MRKLLTNKFAILALLLVAIGVPITIWQIQKSQDVRQRAGANDTILTALSPTSGAFSTGTVTSPLVIQATSTVDIGSVEMVVNYDTQQMSLTTISPQSPLLQLDRQDSAGSTKITLYNPTSSQVVGTNITLLSLVFTPLTPGESVVSISDIKYTASGVSGFIPADPASILSGTYTITGTAAASPTQIPNPSPTQVVQSGETTLGLTFTLSGIGTSSSSAQQLNTNPIRRTRTGDVIVYDGQLNPVDTYQLNAIYDPTTSRYNGTVNLRDLPTGDYLVKMRLENTLFKVLPGIQHLINGTSNVVPTTLELISGDIVRTGTSDNVIDIKDYSAMNSCLSALVSNVSVQNVNDPNCGLQIALKSDFNDDDKIDLKDYNILLRAFTKRVGD